MMKVNYGVNVVLNNLTGVQVTPKEKKKKVGGGEHFLTKIILFYSKRPKGDFYFFDRDYPFNKYPLYHFRVFFFFPGSSITIRQLLPLAQPCIRQLDRFIFDCFRSKDSPQGNSEEKIKFSIFFFSFLSSKKFEVRDQKSHYVHSDFWPKFRPYDCQKILLCITFMKLMLEIWRKVDWRLQLCKTYGIRAHID